MDSGAGAGARAGRLVTGGRAQRGRTGPVVGHGLPRSRRRRRRCLGRLHGQRRQAVSDLHRPLGPGLPLHLPESQVPLQARARPAVAVVRRDGARRGGPARPGGRMDRGAPPARGSIHRAPRARGRRRGPIRPGGRPPARRAARAPRRGGPRRAGPVAARPGTAWPPAGAARVAARPRDRPHGPGAALRRAGPAARRLAGHWQERRRGAGVLPGWGRPAGAGRPPARHGAGQGAAEWTPAGLRPLTAWDGDGRVVVL